MISKDDIIKAKQKKKKGMIFPQSQVPYFCKIVFIYLPVLVGPWLGHRMPVASCSLFSCGARTLWLWPVGFVAPWHVGS